LFILIETFWQNALQRKEIIGEKQNFLRADVLTF